jgi:hypothetical protein
VIEITTPSGGVITEYYDMSTGLKSKTLVMIEGPEGKVRQETKYLEYFTADGIKYPRKLKQSNGPQSFDINVESVLINTNPSEDIFR